MNQQANMVAMNNAGGPVGGMPNGGMPMMNSGGAPRPQPQEDPQRLLNTYIYDYLLKNKQYEIARQVSQLLPINTGPNTKTSPNRQANGVDSMDTDSKDDNPKPDDLPHPSIPNDSSDNSFLLDWWSQFWDIYAAQRNKPNAPKQTMQYLQHARATQMRQDQQRMMINGGMQYRNMMANGGMGMQNELQKRAIANRGNLTQQQMAQMQNMQKQGMMASHMQREGSNMDGQRPSSPGSGENAPSPSKRPRIEGNNTFNGQPVGPGRTQAMQGQQVGATSNQAAAGNMLLQNGINPEQMNPQQFNAFQQANPGMQAKSIEAMNPGVAQGSPMVQQGGEGMDQLFAGNGNPRMAPGAPGQPQQGNHALQDYQMQLMLLEQQNKKRLLMARQEQDSITQQPPGSTPMGQPGQFGAPAMSPSGSRAGGPSPTPNDMKRGTPKMNQAGLPASPMPDGSMVNRGSPVPNFDPNQMPPGMQPGYGYPQMAGNANMMRPPSSHPGNFGGPLSHQQMDNLARSGARMPNGAMWQGQPQMMQQQQGQQPPHMGTPQQRNAAMPPPPAPPAAGEAGRTQPSSPAQQSAQPPTPSQSNKPNPKNKKNAKEAKKPAAKKGGNTGATPASEPEAPTPTPSTPITPMHPNSFNGQQKNGAQPPNGQQAGQPTANAQPVQMPNQMDTNAQPFGDLQGADMNLDFGSLDNPDVLENFDFDSFLNTNDPEHDFGINGFNFDQPVEAGGDGV